MGKTGLWDGKKWKHKKRLERMKTSKMSRNVYLK
jgi:hypothetical protein